MLVLSVIKILQVTNRETDKRFDYCPSVPLCMLRVNACQYVRPKFGLWHLHSVLSCVFKVHMTGHAHCKPGLAKAVCKQPGDSLVLRAFLFLTFSARCDFIFSQWVGEVGKIGGGGGWGRGVAKIGGRLRRFGWVGEVGGRGVSEVGDRGLVRWEGGGGASP